LTTSGQGKMMRADSYPYWAAESGAAKAKLRVCFFTDDRTDHPWWIGLSFVVGICIRRRFGFVRLDRQKKLLCPTRCNKVVSVLQSSPRRGFVASSWEQLIRWTQICVQERELRGFFFFALLLGSSARFARYYRRGIMDAGEEF
jgi:hypothetical protein